MTRARRTLVALLGVGLAGTLGIGAALSILGAASRTGSAVAVQPSAVHGTHGTGMMPRWALEGDGHPVDSPAAARHRAQLVADPLGLTTGEVIQFSNGFYAQLLDADGHGALEVLIDRTGGVGVEYGPASMWNTRYGMHAAAATGAPRLSAAEARLMAQRSLDARHSGLTAGRPEPFPGYYTLLTMRSDTIAGMMSVNASTGEMWYHTWHGAFLVLDEG